MNEVSASSPRFLGMSAGYAAAAVIVVTTLFRFFYATWLPMLPDETYYFEWSRHLDASYYSKGPAVAYTIWLGTKVFGANNFGIRFFAVLLSAGTAWQIFLLARRWYDETAALIAVLIAGVIPLYAVGAVLMTIDPLSAFFWVCAANFFSRAIRANRRRDWLFTGFAVGCGFLAKYLNALELVAFLVFLVIVPARRNLLGRSGFWLMLLIAVACALPVFWWNQQHGWASATQLGVRGHVHDRFRLTFSTFGDFFGSQALVVSPLLFLALLVAAARAKWSAWKSRGRVRNEGELLLFLLFLSVFLFYAVLALHIRCEANWPAVSYLSLLIVLAGHWREILAHRGTRLFIAAAFCLAWLETVALHDTAILPLSAHGDPMSRTAGWSQLAGAMQQQREATGADVFLADGYKEASVISFYLPDQHFVSAVRHRPVANQYDFWPMYPTAPPHRILWITDDKSPEDERTTFASVRFIERIQIWFRGVPLRAYRIYLCEGPVGESYP